MQEDMALASRLEAFAAYCERFLPGTIRQSECADIRLAATRIRAMAQRSTGMPEPSRASHMS